MCASSSLAAPRLENTRSGATFRRLPGHFGDLGDAHAIRQPSDPKTFGRRQTREFRRLPRVDPQLRPGDPRSAREPWRGRFPRPRDPDSRARPPNKRAAWSSCRSATARVRWCASRSISRSDSVFHSLRFSCRDTPHTTPRPESPSSRRVRGRLRGLNLAAVECARHHLDGQGSRGAIHFGGPRRRVKPTGAAKPRARGAPGRPDAGIWSSRSTA